MTYTTFMSVIAEYEKAVERDAYFTIDSLLKAADKLAEAAPRRNLRQEEWDRMMEVESRPNSLSSRVKRMQDERRRQRGR